LYYFEKEDKTINRTISLITKNNIGIKNGIIERVIHSGRLGSTTAKKNNPFQSYQSIKLIEFCQNLGQERERKEDRKREKEKERETGSLFGFQEIHRKIK